MDIVYLIKSQVRRSFKKVKYICVCETLKDAESRVDAYNETNSVETLKSMSHMPYEMFHRMKSSDKNIYSTADSDILEFLEKHPDYIRDGHYFEDLELYDTITNERYDEADIVPLPFNRKPRIAFISGHRDITESEFQEHYIPILDKAIKDGDSFVVGDYYGVDIMAQNYLASNGVDKERVTVCHMFEKPRNIAPAYSERTKGMFRTDIERDSYMTWHSDYDIAWIREGKASSGTAQNVIRRYGTTGISNI